MPRLRRTAAAAATILLTAIPVLAQQEVPNPMAAHTVFVIVVTAAFLVWAASYSVHFYRDRGDRGLQHVEALGARREALLDEIAALEAAHESGNVTASRYKREMKARRGELARTIGKLNAAESGRKASSAGRKRA